MRITEKSPDARAVSLASSAAFDRFYKFLACAALILISAPVIYSFVRPAAGLPAATICAAAGAPLLFGVGYVFQAVFGAVTGVRRGEASRAYEKLVTYFKLSEAALPLALCGAAGVAVISAVSRIMRMRYEAGLDWMYDRWSLIPFVAGLAAAALIAAGIVAWFYPYSRIISMHSMFAYLVIIVANFAVNVVFGISQNFLVACAALFLLFVAVVMNQGHIVNVINAAGTGLLTPRVRFYNLIAVGIFCLLIAAVVPLVITLFVGVAVLARMALFFILRGILGNTEELQYEDASEQASQFSSGMFGNIGDLGGESLAKGYFALFALLLIAVLILVIIIRRRNVFRIIYNFINDLFANLMDFLANIFEFNRFSTEKFALSDYRDVETKTDKTAIHEYKAIGKRAPRSYREFRRRLDAVADARGRLVLAYNELIRCWGDGIVKLSISDTPSEIERKVIESTSNTNAEVITRAFETVKYAELDLPTSESERLVGVMCAQIRRAYGDT